MTIRRSLVVAVGAVMLAASACGDNSSKEAELATGTVEKVVGFDAQARQQSESLAVDESGDVYVTFPFLGKIVRIRSGSTKVEDFGSVPVETNDFGTLGVAIDDDDVLVGVQSKASNGVWRFSKSGGAGRRIQGSEAIGFPNDLAVDDDGDIYVASSVEGKDASGANLGAVWRISTAGKVEKWLVSPTLGGTGTSGLPVPIGANGIAVRDNTLFIANTEQGQVLTVAIDDDGKPGEPSVLAKDAQLNGSDGIALDDAGNVFVAVIAQSQIVRIDKDDHTVTTIAKDADGLDFTSSVKFGAGDSDGDLLALNFAIAELLGGKTVEGPALLRIPGAD